MAEHRFDELSKLFGARASRRGVLKAAIGIAAGGLFSRFGRDEATAANREPAVAPATDAFQRTWERTDRPVAEGAVARTWMWGPEAFTEALSEPYEEAPDGNRTVQYFDKARMEDNSFRADGPPWDVTNGLLVVELITGRLQLGDSQFEDRQPAQINVAGDANDPDGPTYATFGNALDAPPSQVGATITQRITRASMVSNDPGLAGQGVTVAIVDDVTNHSIAAPFWEFMNSSGPVYQDGQVVAAPLFDSAYFATGRPITEPYWANVLVGGTQRLVLVQCFERRCLTYTPGNPDGFVVEAGNVGQHYYEWRTTPSEDVSVGDAPPEVEAALSDATGENAHYLQLAAYLANQGFTPVGQRATVVAGAGLVDTGFLSVEFANAPPNPLRASIIFDPLSDERALVYATVVTAQEQLLYLLYVNAQGAVQTLFPPPELPNTTGAARELEGGSECAQCLDNCNRIPSDFVEHYDQIGRTCSEIATIICETAFATSIDDDFFDGVQFALMHCAVAVTNSCLVQSVIPECEENCSAQCSGNCENCSGADHNNGCCNNRCTDLDRDANNCRACGARCAQGERCCDGVCLDVLSDTVNCGGCGHSCPAGHDCINGVCTPPTGPCADCPGNDVANFCCGNMCMDLRSDAYNCGTCGLECFPGQICCDGICLNPLDDDLNCGTCGVVCEEDEDCIDGICSEPDPCDECGEDEACCGSVCIDVTFDNDNCGDCGIACAAGWACMNGVCERLPECEDETDCFGCDICVEGMCVECPGKCCDGGLCVPEDACCPGLIDCGFGLCCGGDFPICCYADGYCCSAQFPVCCGNRFCCSSAYPVCCSDYCCPDGCFCDGFGGCDCDNDFEFDAEALKGITAVHGANSAAETGVTYW